MAVTHLLQIGMVRMRHDVFDPAPLGVVQLVVLVARDSGVHGLGHGSLAVGCTMATPTTTRHAPTSTLLLLLLLLLLLKERRLGEIGRT